MSTDRSRMIASTCPQRPPCRAASASATWSGHPRAVRRARHAGRAGRGDREGRRHRPRARSTGSSPPRRSSTSSRSRTTWPSSTSCCARAHRPREPRGAARGWTRAYAGFCLALPGVPGLRAVADAAAGGRAARAAVGLGVAAARPGHRRLRRARRRDPARARGGGGTPTTSRTCCGPRSSARTHLARIGVGIRQAAPGVPALFAVEREQLVATCVQATRAAIG